MAAETFTYSPKRLIAGADPDVVVRPGTVVSGQNLAVGTILASDANGKWYAHPGFATGYVASASAGSPTTAIDVTLPIAGILQYAVNASTGTTDNAGNTVAAGVAADAQATAIVAADIFADQLVWTGVTGTGTNLLKQKFFDKSKIVLTFLDTGEV